MQNRACEKRSQLLPTSPDSDRAHVRIICSPLLSNLFPVVLRCDNPVAIVAGGKLCRDQPDAVGVCGDQSKGWFRSRATVEWFVGSHPVGEPSRHCSDRVFAVPECAHTEPFARLDGPVVLVQWLAFGLDAGVSMGVAPLAQT